MLEVISKRRACRKFNDKPVEDEKINEIVQAGLHAPSGMGRQTPVIIVIKDKKTRDELAKLNNDLAGGRWGDDFDPFYGAPVILLVIADKNGLSVHDGSATIENMLLEATNQGLATCWIHRAEEEIKSEEGRKLLSFTGLDFNNYIGIGHIALGYTDIKEYPQKVIKEGRVFIK